jgi:prepilin-type processing-associated H-X9-DG protein
MLSSDDAAYSPIAVSRYRMHPWFLLVGLPIWLLVFGCVQAMAAASPCSPRAFEGSNYIVCTFDLRAYALRLFWKDGNARPYGGFDRLPHTLNGAPIAFAMNAGMYETDLSPVGLYVENGKTLKRVNTANGPGNFHLKPNGILYVSDEEAGVVTTERFLYQKPRADFATQSGPMLVINGKIHPKILPSSDSRKVRDGVGLRDAHTVVFAISEGAVTFWEFARLFRDGLGSANALFLDGSISSLYAPALGRSDTLYPMGPIIAAFERK